MNRENLKKISAHMRTVSQNAFDISSYYRDEQYNNDAILECFETFGLPSECGSVACGIGHTATMGGEFAPREGEDWTDYAGRVMGVDLRDYENSAIFEWCFGGFWQAIDNTPIGVSQRIDYFLEHGLPDNHEDQMYGLSPLCYKNNGEKNGKK